MAVAEPRIQADVHTRRRVGPLRLEVLGRCDHDHPVDLVRAQQLDRERERERGLAGARRRGDEEVPALGDPEVLLQSFALPCPQPSAVPQGAR
jgi:hypothetical protein